MNSVFGDLVGSAYATQPHSLFLSVLVYTGIIGTFIYLFLLYKSLLYIDLKITDQLQLFVGLILYVF